MLAVQGADALNFGAAGEAFLILPVSALLVFAVLVIAAIINVRRAEWHKRLMLSATAVSGLVKQRSCSA